MQAGLTYRRRLEGRALEHGFVTHITGIARDTIRMLRKDEGSSSLTEEPVEGADARAILRAIIICFVLVSMEHVMTQR